MYMPRRSFGSALFSRSERAARRCVAPRVPKRRIVGLLGPAFVAAIAYVDPGNFATNFAGGSAYGYALLWVVVAANLMAMLVQALAAKLGLATGRNLPQLCRDRFPRWAGVLLWVQAEAVIMATDVAEVVGGALAVRLLFGLPLLEGGLLTGAIACLLLAVHHRSQAGFERVVAVALGVVLLGFALQLWRAGVDPSGVGGGLVPSLMGPGAMFTASAIIGATVMPHAIYLHSDLTTRKYAGARAVSRRRALSVQRTDIVCALGAAGLVNAAMMIVAAGLVFGSGSDVAGLEDVHRLVEQAAGPVTALAFAGALLASGLASSGVGTFAAQVVMDGFVGRRVPLLARRLIGLVPALVVLGCGMDPTHALLLSQVVLSVGVPFALLPLIYFTSRRSVMGELCNRRITTLSATATASVIVALNVVLVVETLG